MVNLPASLYDPANSFDITTEDVEYLDDKLATVYTPEGTGPFPALVSVHGGAWSSGTRKSTESVDKALAKSGIVVVSIDFPPYAYPDQVVHFNYAVRWLKTNARQFNADPELVGGLGASSGGHTVMLSAMRPLDVRYFALTVQDAPEVDATLSYVLALWPVLDPSGRYDFARNITNDRHSGDRLVSASEAYFGSTDAMREGNPQLILERGENIELPPTFVVYGTADRNVPLAGLDRYVELYRGAGGIVEVAMYRGMRHGFGTSPGPETDDALDRMKNFVALQVN